MGGVTQVSLLLVPENSVPPALSLQKRDEPRHLDSRPPPPAPTSTPQLGWDSIIQVLPPPHPRGPQRPAPGGGWVALEDGGCTLPTDPADLHQLPGEDPLHRLCLGGKEGGEWGSRTLTTRIGPPTRIRLLTWFLAAIWLKLVKGRRAMGSVRGGGGGPGAASSLRLTRVLGWGKGGS